MQLPGAKDPIPAPSLNWAGRKDSGVHLRDGSFCRLRYNLPIGLFFHLALTPIAPTRAQSVVRRPQTTLASPPTHLKLIPDIEPWGRSFRRNLADLLLRRDPPAPKLTETSSDGSGKRSSRQRGVTLKSFAKNAQGAKPVAPSRN